MCSWLRESTNPLASFTLFYVPSSPIRHRVLQRVRMRQASKLYGPGFYSLCVERDMKNGEGLVEVRFISFADHVPAPRTVCTHIVVCRPSFFLFFYFSELSRPRLIIQGSFLFSWNLFLNVRSLTHDGLFRERSFSRYAAHDGNTCPQRGPLLILPICIPTTVRVYLSKGVDPCRLIRKKKKENLLAGSYFFIFLF